MNGLSSGLEHLAAAISDAGDSWIIPTPYYYAFKQDLGAVSKVGIVGVEVEEGRQGEMEEVEACEREMQRREREGETSKVKAIILSNPHNPLGAFPFLSSLLSRDLTIAFLTPTQASATSLRSSSRTLDSLRSGISTSFPTRFTHSGSSFYSSLMSSDQLRVLLQCVSSPA
jgi:hypothetical protein